MNLKIEHDLPIDRWSAYVDQHPQGNIFHTPEMFQVLAQTKNHIPTLWAAVDETGHPQAMFVSTEISLGKGPFRWLTTRSVVYGGLLFNDDEAGKHALDTLLKVYLKHKPGNSLFTEFRNQADVSSIQPLLNGLGFEYEDHLNYLIDIGLPEADILQNIGRRTRKHIRRGLKKNAVMVREVTSLDGVALCHKILKETYRQAGVPLVNSSLFEAAFSVLYPLERVKFWLAEVDGVPIATSVELLYKDTMYGWYGGLNRGYARFTPGELLMWHILAWGSRHNFRVYDFGGAGKPDEDYGVREFKAKFGGNLVNFGRNIVVHQPGLLAVSQWGYGVLQNMQRMINGRGR